jgi:E3 ubiquitin-protein ligase BRE1
LKEREISEEKKKLQTRLEYLEKRVPGTGSSEDDPVVVNLKQQVEDLLLFKKVSQCNVCNFRLKKFVILRCMHVFCQNCVEERLESRQRRCPECGINFGQGDVKQIYI